MNSLGLIFSHFVVYNIKRPANSIGHPDFSSTILLNFIQLLYGEYPKTMSKQQKQI